MHSLASKVSRSESNWIHEGHSREKLDSTSKADSNNYATVIGARTLMGCHAPTAYSHPYIHLKHLCITCKAVRGEIVPFLSLNYPCQLLVTWTFSSSFHLCLELIFSVKFLFLLSFFLNFLCPYVLGIIWYYLCLDLEYLHLLY